MKWAWNKTTKTKKTVLKGLSKNYTQSYAILIFELRKSRQQLLPSSRSASSARQPVQIAAGKRFIATEIWGSSSIHEQHMQPDRKLDKSRASKFTDPRFWTTEMLLDRWILRL